MDHFYNQLSSEVDRLEGLPKVSSQDKFVLSKEIQRVEKSILWEKISSDKSAELHSRIAALK